MTALGKLVRTTAFKIIAVYLIVFALFAAGVIAYLARHTQQLVVSQITETVDAEMRSLQEEFTVGGINRLVDVVEARAQQPGSNLYLVTTFAGAAIVGNVEVPNETLGRPGWSEISYRRAEDPDDRHVSRALVRVSVLPGGFRLLVGRDFEERDRLRQILAKPARWAVVFLVILGVGGGLFIARRVLKRIDAMTETSDRIMAGDLSGRLPVAGSGDEFDRLANSLNAMLERIEGLMTGVKQVSDNIAHDLKTPLTRLRNQAEEALRASKSEADYRAALEATIEESDALIRTFDALLMISRAEAGEVRTHMADFDAADVANSVGELYEPLAEEKGLKFVVEAEPPLPCHGNRELIGQALANLVDNAIKHGEPVTPGIAGEVRVHARAAGGRILLTVADRGPGIPDGERRHVLERFVRLEASRSRPGAGLGLSLAAAVARLHGGELLLEDNNPGLRATLAIPVPAR
ncbi:MAG: HAMP domain-containing protein [Bradyrhizobiaceae bacterium]|nr:HAMP domain-containing protein [Bradyrhizobiaceae bacterium]